VKLLFDQNHSHRLVSALADVFPDSDHVRTVGLARADDEAVWQHAAAQGFAIVSRDRVQRLGLSSAELRARPPTKGGLDTTGQLFHGRD